LRTLPDLLKELHYYSLCLLNSDNGRHYCSQLEEVKQLIMLFQSFRQARMMQLQLLVCRPDSVCDILVYHRQVPLMTNDFTDTTIFQHQGIVSALYRQFPEPHFFITGFPEAVHNALESFYLAQVLQRLSDTSCCAGR
jgi:hypothetical protein